MPALPPAAPAPRAGRRLLGPALAATLVGLLAALGAVPATALLRIDFEQSYYVHPGLQVWDFCLVQHEGLHHIFYHTLPEEQSGPTHADTLWHAVSADLVHWERVGPALTVGPDWWEAGALWAPDVVRDEPRGRWAMLYTGVDSLQVQRACAAFSPDLETWTRSPANPVFAPDSLTYHWAPSQAWSSFRDPFLYHADGVWHMLSTAALRLGTYPGYRRAIVHRAVSADLEQWSDAGVFFESDSETPWKDLESCQYWREESWHHLFCAEYDVPGTTHLVAADPAAWTMDARAIFDTGGAPELDEIAPGVRLFSRLGKGFRPLTGGWLQVVRCDTLDFEDGGATPRLRRSHPLDRDWAVCEGLATLGNPTFGDNTAERGEASCGLAGHGWFGSREYYQGPLSGRGSPGTELGDEVTGRLVSHPFVVTGDVIRLRVGGGRYPETCYVALLDAATDTVLRRATGHGAETMVERVWDVRPFRGRLAVLTIVDEEAGPMGHINVDEIEELAGGLSPVPAAGGTPAPLRLLGTRPNPANPAVTVRFSLERPGRIRLHVHDLRGRTVGRGPARDLDAGPQALTWRGVDAGGRPVGSGVYLYSLTWNGRAAGRGKFTLAR